MNEPVRMGRGGRGSQGCRSGMGDGGRLRLMRFRHRVPRSLPTGGLHSRSSNVPHVSITRPWSGRNCHGPPVRYIRRWRAWRRIGASGFRDPLRAAGNPSPLILSGDGSRDRRAAKEGGAATWRPNRGGIVSNSGSPAVSYARGAGTPPSGMVRVRGASTAVPIGTAFRRGSRSPLPVRGYRHLASVFESYGCRRYPSSARTITDVLLLCAADDC